MQIYLTTILTACYVFPVLAAFLTIPYIIHQYHKYGSVLMLRTAIIYSFVFYLLTAYFMTILPLPAVESVQPMEQTVFLEPFNVVRNWIDVTGFDIHDPATYFRALTSSSLWVIIFNILLLLPLGVYLRYYYQRKWWQTLLISFGCSLFFEITQLSGLYGIYPYPYRFFEVDDLICNTLGGMLGFWLTPLFSFFLPSRERIDELAYKKGHHVSVIRSLLENGIDLLIFGIIGFVMVYILPFETQWWSVLMVPVYLCVMFTVVTYLTQGYTPGKYLVSVRLQRRSGRRLTLWQLLVRHFLLYVVCVPLAMYGAVLFFTARVSRDGQMKMACYTGAALCAMGFAAFAAHIIRCALQHREQPFYDRLCRVVCVSVVDDKWAKAHEYTLEKIELEDETMHLENGRPDTTENRMDKEIRVYDFLDSLHIEYQRIDHEAAMTMEACEEIDKALGAMICKNLLLCNRQETEFYLLLMPGDKPFKTKYLSAQIGSARLSFAKAEYMEEFLDITPGSLSVLGLMNDKENRVQLLIDEDALKDEYFGCHPCINTSSLRIRTEDLMQKIIPAMGHEPRMVKLPVAEE